MKMYILPLQEARFLAADFFIPSFLFDPFDM